MRISDVLDVELNSRKRGMMNPVDYPYLFLLETTSRTFYLYAATSEEREIWVHDFSNFMTNNKATPLNSVRSKIKENIDPFESMEVINLSKHAMMMSQELVQVINSDSEENDTRFKPRP